MKHYITIFTMMLSVLCTAQAGAKDVQRGCMAHMDLPVVQQTRTTKASEPNLSVPYFQTELDSYFRAYLDGGTAASEQAYAISHGVTPTGIGRVAAGSLDICAGRAHVVLVSDAVMTVNIVTAAGVTVRTMQLRPDIPQIVTLPVGVYLVNNRKIIVR